MRTELTWQESMCLHNFGLEKEKASKRQEVAGYDTPIYTLYDLLDILPNSLEDYHSNNLEITKTYMNEWMVSYMLFDEYHSPIKFFARNELIEAIYEMLVWIYYEKEYNEDEK